MNKVLKSSLRFLFALVTLANFSLAQGAESENNQEISILVMGDSLSAAYYIPPEKGWVNLLAQRLESHAFDRPVTIKVHNSSISGATTAAGLQALPSALDTFKPDIVILEMGGNDGLQGKTLSNIKQNLEEMIRLSQAAESEVLLVGIRLPPNLGSRYTEPFFKQYAEIAQKYQLTYVPFLLEGVAGNFELMQSDGIHPKAEGQPIMLENVWPSLLALIQSQIDNR